METNGNVVVVAPAPVWMNVDDVAKELGVPASSVRGFVASRGLKAYSLGRIKRFLKHEVQAWLLTQVHDPAKSKRGPRKVKKAAPAIAKAAEAGANVKK